VLAEAHLHAQEVLDAHGEGVLEADGEQLAREENLRVVAGRGELVKLVRDDLRGRRNKHRSKLITPPLANRDGHDPLTPNKA
jgi:hypothetical protein